VESIGVSSTLFAQRDVETDDGVKINICGWNSVTLKMFWMFGECVEAGTWN
jgi:hypothetical protein